jgi:hypothetical protein
MWPGYGGGLSEGFGARILTVRLAADSTAMCYGFGTRRASGLYLSASRTWLHRAVVHAEEERLKTTPPPVRLSEGVSGLDCFWVIGLARGLALMGCCWTPLGCAGGLHGQVIW